MLYRHPAIAEVAVIGEPDPRKGERLCALVVARGGLRITANSVDFCAQHLVRYKIRSEFLFVGSLPKTAVGKIDPEVLKSQPPNSSLKHS